MIYAPVVIPTLNRVEHLKRCLDSLRNNPWAINTEIYISVDYPPSEKYFAGYEEVKEYLSGNIQGFKSVNLFFQNSNLGSADNYEYLVNWISTEYDRYIYLEDDIEVSPNFLEFIDKGLGLFENDEKIIAICACGAHCESCNGENVVLSQNYSAWGVGQWIKKDEELRKRLTRSYFVEKGCSLKEIKKILDFNYSLFFSFQSMIRKKEDLYWDDEVLPMHDQLIKMVCAFESYYMVGACIRKARTWGYDGSGTNCDASDDYDPGLLPIDHNEHFDYSYSTPMRILSSKTRMSVSNWVRVIVGCLKLTWWRFTNAQ